MREAMLLTDMAERVVSGPVSEVGKPGVWRRASYETAEVKGTLVGCMDRTEPAGLVIRLGVTGLWRVWLGVPVFHDVTRIRAAQRGYVFDGDGVAGGGLSSCGGA